MDQGFVLYSNINGIQIMHGQVQLGQGVTEQEKRVRDSHTNDSLLRAKMLQKIRSRWAGKIKNVRHLTLVAVIHRLWCSSIQCEFERVLHQLFSVSNRVFYFASRGGAPGRLPRLLFVAL